MKESNVIQEDYKKAKNQLMATVLELIEKNINTVELERRYSHDMAKWIYTFRIRKNNTELRCTIYKSIQKTADFSLVVSIYKLSWWGLSETYEDTLYWHSGDKIDNEEVTSRLNKNLSDLLYEFDATLERQQQEELDRGRVKSIENYYKLSDILK
jgi:hypothetical protein